MLIESGSFAIGNKTYINTYEESCCIIGLTNKEDIRKAIDEFEKDKLKNLWKSLSHIVVDGDIEYLECFRSRATTHEGRSPVHFNSECLRSILGVTLRGAELCRYLQTLPLEGQEYVLDVCFPKTFEQIEETLRDCCQFPTNKLNLLKFSYDENDFLEKLTTLITNSNTPTHTRYDSYNFLIKLWSQGLILLPTSIINWSICDKWKTFDDATLEVHDTLKQIYTSSDRKGYSDRCLSYIATLFAISSAKTKKDLSLELIRTFELAIADSISRQQVDKGITEKTKSRQKSDLRKSIVCLLDAYNSVNPHNKINTASWAAPEFDSRVRKDITFKWLTAKAPHLASWSEYFSLYLNSLNHARLNTQLAGLIHIANFLTTLDSPPEKPWLIIRRIHVFDARLIIKNTLLNYLKENTTQYVSAHVLHIGRRFFLWLRDYLVSTNQDNDSLFQDPILEEDKIGKPIYHGKTNRDSLPPYLISEMKSIITDDDFAFAKSLKRQIVRTTDQHSGYNTRAFYPGTAICMYSLLDAPIRSHQARWLDSGVLDENIYNFSTGEYERNYSEYAIADRNEGVVRLSGSALRSEKWLAMHINTNKSPREYDETGKIGYTIPYISPQLASLVKVQLDWTHRYLPKLTKPLNYRYHMQQTRELRKDKDFKGPEIAPLFRDPSAPGQLIPIGYDKLTRFYVQLLVETEKRVESKYNQKIKLTTVDKNGTRQWVIDLHSLRVSGITNLIEAGVPIEVVQQFVAGHQTLVMTLHYLKYSPEKLRSFIEEANRRMQEDKDFVGSQTFIDSLNDVVPFLLSQGGAGTGPGFEALNSGDGIIVINTDGICPGTSCSSGYVVREGANTVYGPVPGGRRCPLCRYWLTGPAHLLGQINGMNNLAYSIRKKGLEIRRLNDLEADALDVGNKRGARSLRDKIDLLNRELDVDVAEWAARYNYAMQSIALMDDYLETKSRIIATDATLTDATTRVPMVTPSAPLELKATLEKAHEFVLLDQITQLADFNPGFPNLQAELEKNQMLSKVMVANGIKPFLLTLTEQQAREAGSLLSALMLQQVQSFDLDEVLTGKKPLSAYPYLSQAMRELEQASSDGIGFIPNAMTAISKLITPAEPSALSEDDEDTFG
ncbi:Phage integrase family protein [compost metagenome]